MKKSVGCLLLCLLLSLVSVMAFNYEGSYLAIDVKNAITNQNLNGTYTWKTYLYSSSSTCSGTPTATDTGTATFKDGKAAIDFTYNLNSASAYIKGGRTGQNYSCFRYIANTINNTGGWNLNTSYLINKGGLVNITKNITFNEYILSGRGTNGQNSVKIFPIDLFYGYTQLAFYPEGNKSRVEGDVLFNIHKRLSPSNTTHRHMSIYTTGSDDDLNKRFDLEYKEDYADVDWSNIDVYRVSAQTVRFTDGENDGFNTGGIQWGLVELSYDQTTNTSLFQFSPQSNISRSNARVRFFRETNMTGNLYFEIYKGDNTATQTFLINPRNGMIENFGGINRSQIYLYTDILTVDDEGGVSGSPKISLNGDRGVIEYNGGNGSLRLIGGGGKNLDFFSNGIIRSRITSGGTWGVNTTSPNALFSVNGNMSVANELRAEKVYSGNQLVGNISGGGTAQYIPYFSSSTGLVNSNIKQETNGDISIDTDIVYINTTSNTMGIKRAPSTYELRIGGTGAGDLQVYRIWGDADAILSNPSETVKIQLDNSRAQVDLTGKFNTTSEVYFGGIKADGTGKVVCIKSDGALGSCSSIVGVDGTCTCG